MKKIIALLLTLCMVVAMTACGSSSAPAAAPAAAAPAAAAPAAAAPAEPTVDTWGLKPLAQPQKIRCALFTGSLQSYMSYFAEQLGVLDALNIDADFVWFTGGPAMLEAGADWDICELGIGGIAIGLSTYDYTFIEATDYEDNMAVFVRPDSAIAKDPTNPEVWKGAECIYPAGTSAQMVLAAYLNTMGLTLADVVSTNADVSNALTVFSGGTGDVIAVWNAIAFAAEDAGYIRVTDCGQLGNSPICGTFVHPDFLADNHELVSLLVAAERLTNEWVYAHPEEATTMFFDHCEEEGFLVTEDVAAKTVEWFAGPTAEEYVKYFTTEGAEDADAGRKLLVVEEQILNGYDFFVSEGKYTAEQRATWLKDCRVDNSVAAAVAELIK